MERFRDGLWINEKAATFLSYLLVGMMMACLMLTVVQVQAALVPDWRSRGMVFLGLLVSLEVFFTQRLRKDLEILTSDWFYFYTGEVLVLMVVIRSFQALGSPGGILVELSSLRGDFVNALFNEQFILNLLAIGIVWLVSLGFSAPLDILRITPQRVLIEQESLEKQERSDARQKLIDLVIMIGVGMVVLTSLLRHPYGAGLLRIDIPELGRVNILVYFMLGLVLLSLTQFNSLQMRWAINKLPVSKHLARRWAAYSLLSLTLLVGITLFLPTRYTLPILTVLGWLMGILTAVGSFLFWLLTLPIFIAGALLSGTPVETTLIPPTSVPAQVQDASIAALPDLLVLLRSLVFWIGLPLLVIYVLIHFFRLRRLHLAELRNYPLMSWFLSLCDALIIWLKQTRRSADIFLKQRPWRTRSPAAAHPHKSIDRWSYLGLRRLSSRQQVLFYYLAMVRRGGESGIPRQPAQTPSEYAAELSQVLQAADVPILSQPEAVEDIQAITDRFIEARYSRHPISGEQADRVKNIWMRLRKLLQRGASAHRYR